MNHKYVFVCNYNDDNESFSENLPELKTCIEPQNIFILTELDISTAHYLKST